MLGPSGSVVSLQREAAGLLFSKTVFEPHTILGRHTHANAYLSFAGTGSYTERIGGAARQCDSSAALLHPAGETHEDVFHGRPVELLRVEVTDPDLLPLPTWKFADVGMRDEGSLYLCRRMLNELQHPDDLSPFVLQALAHEAFAHLARARRAERSPGPAWLRKVDDFLAETYLEPMRIADLAGMAGVHPVHLCRTYSRLRGRTIGDRVRELRMQKACSLLAGTDQPIGEIAILCGFADQSHLARLMRRSFGVSPSQYRELR